MPNLRNNPFRYRSLFSFLISKKEINAFDPYQNTNYTLISKVPCISIGLCNQNCYTWIM